MVRYEVEVWSRTATYGIGSLLLNVARLKNLGLADYLNDVPEAFFSLYQDDPQVADLRNYRGKAHVRIYRMNSGAGNRDLLWTGLLGTEISSRGEDVIFYAHGYLAILYWLHTDWAQSWSIAQINTIVSDLITRAKTEIADSEFQFVATGTVEAPPTISDGSTPIVLARYDTFWKRILFVLREMGAIARSDTTNVAVFEVTHTLAPTFNFWKDKGNDTSVVWTYGGEILDYDRTDQPALTRNQALGVGTSPRDLTLKSDQSVAVGTTGRRQEAILFQWVRDQTELDRVTKLRLTKGNTDYLNLGLTMYPGILLPPRATGATWSTGDRVGVRIDNGIDNIDSQMLVTGAQVFWLNGSEFVRPIVEQRSGI